MIIHRAKFLEHNFVTVIVLCVDYSFSCNIFKANTILILILHMKNLSFINAKCLAQSHTDIKLSKQDLMDCIFTIIPLYIILKLIDGFHDR